jgi:hypothetical protein
LRSVKVAAPLVLASSPASRSKDNNMAGGIAPPAIFKIAPKGI